MVDFLVNRRASESSERLSASSGGSVLLRERESDLLFASSVACERQRVGSEACCDPRISACGLSRVIYSFSISKTTFDGKSPWRRGVSDGVCSRATRERYTV